LQAIKQLELEDIVTLTYNISEADAVIALHSKLKKNSQIQAVVKSQDIPVFFVKTNSLSQITRALRALVDDHMDELIDYGDKEEARSSEETDALEEARLAIEQVVIPKGESVQLLPRPASIISSQVDLVESFSLKWEVVGQEPNSRVRILPLHGRGSHRRRARNRRHRARRSWEPRRPGSYPPGRHHQATFPPRVEQSILYGSLAGSFRFTWLYIHPLISVQLPSESTLCSDRKKKALCVYESSR